MWRWSVSAGALTGAGVLVSLCSPGCSNYLLFHSIIEVFSIVIAFDVFMVVWNTRREAGRDVFWQLLQGEAVPSGHAEDTVLSRRGEERYCALFEHSIEGVSTMGPQGRLATANADTVALVDMPPEDTQGRHFHELVMPDSARRTVEIVQRLQSGGESRDAATPLRLATRIGLRVGAFASPGARGGRIAYIWGAVT